MTALHLNNISFLFYRDGLTPPPRVITMRDKDTGAEVVTEWQSQHSLRVS